MLTIDSSMMILMSCSIIVVSATFWLNINYYLTYPRDFAESYFTETLLIFPYHDVVISVVFLPY